MEKTSQKRTSELDTSEFLSIDELLCDFPAEFEQALVDLDQGAIPSGKLIEETRQMMVQVNNLQQYELQQSENRDLEEKPSRHDAILDSLIPLSLFLSACLIIGLLILLYVTTPFILKELILLGGGLIAGEWVLLSIIISWKQKRVKERRREKCQK